MRKPPQTAGVCRVVLKHLPQFPESEISKHKALLSFLWFIRIGCIAVVTSLRMNVLAVIYSGFGMLVWQCVETVPKQNPKPKTPMGKNGCTILPICFHCRVVCGNCAQAYCFPVKMWSIGTLVLDSCLLDGFQVKLWNILSYNNSRLDVALNYGALVVCTVPLVKVLSPLKTSLGGKYFWLPLSAFLFIFQVSKWANLSHTTSTPVTCSPN